MNPAITYAAANLSRLAMCKDNLATLESLSPLDKILKHLNDVSNRTQYMRERFEVWEV